MGAYSNSFGIRAMKTRWGSCNIRSKKIWLNLELVKKPVECLEYVLVHELTHLFERYHNARFYALMDEFLPDWRERKKLTNQFI
ncbi:MAG TPA: M48 family peptidase, partial [Idiomarina loihiensis]|nr:M48 family peptidase [Idiomarina loihiensis]